MKKAIIGCLLASTLLSGCVVRVADMTVASSKNYNLNSNNFVKGKRVIGEDLAPVAIFPLGIPNVKTALDRAIEKDGKCSVALTDVVVSQLNQAFLFGRIGYRVEGTQVIDANQAGCSSYANK